MAPCIGLSIKEVWITVSGSNNWAVKSFCAFRGAGFLGIHCEQESSRISMNFNKVQFTEKNTSKRCSVLRPIL